jgi:hypothetical protein
MDACSPKCLRPVLANAPVRASRCPASGATHRPSRLPQGEEVLRACGFGACLRRSERVLPAGRCRVFASPVLASEVLASSVWVGGGGRGEVLRPGSGTAAGESARPAVPLRSGRSSRAGRAGAAVGRRSRPPHTAVFGSASRKLRGSVFVAVGAGFRWQRGLAGVAPQAGAPPQAGVAPQAGAPRRAGAPPRVAVPAGAGAPPGAEAAASRLRRGRPGRRTFAPGGGAGPRPGPAPASPSVGRRSVLPPPRTARR